MWLFQSRLGTVTSKPAEEEIKRMQKMRSIVIYTRLLLLGLLK
jgi:hypothetical protein